MVWSIDSITLTAHSLPGSTAFFQEVVGLTPNAGNDTPQFGAGRRGMFLRPSQPAFAAGDRLETATLDHPHVCLAVDNFDKLAVNLDAASIDYRMIEDALFVFEPSGNLIAFRKANGDGSAGGVHPWEKDWGWGLHHVNLEALDVRASVAFLVEIAGMEEGRWQPPEDMGDFSIDPAKLAILPLGEGNRGLHLIEPDPGFGYRNNFPHNPSIGGHPAFWVRDIHAVMKRLDEAEILYSDAKVYAMPGMHQIYVYDPNMNMIEVNQYV